VFERFTDRARRVLVLAQEEARLLNHSFIGTEHILLGLIHEGEGLAAKALESLGISLEAVREKVEETIGPASAGPTGDSPPFTPRAKKVLELSLREALQLGHNYIGTEHILLGLVREDEGVGAQVLVSLGADLPRVRQQVIQLLSGYSGRVGSTGLRPPGAEVRVEPTESSPVPISDSWTIQVVRAGRTPDAFADAYRRMEHLVREHGVDLDELRINVTSVETIEGPGLRLVVRYETADDAATSTWDRPEDASGNEPPV
jgi:ATP-dependent Clp protease ATP-binding subunit ClpA